MDRFERLARFKVAFTTLSTAVLAKEKCFDEVATKRNRLAISRSIFCRPLTISYLFLTTRNRLFFYSSGVLLGLIMSPLVVVYILHRLVPWRVDAYAVLTGGWIAGAYLMYRSLPNLNHLSLKHYGWIIGYFVIVGVISFCVCYYYGPVTSDRGLDLMRWILQSIGLFLLYKISRSLVFLLYTICGSRIVLYFLRLILRGWFRYRVYYFFFPPKHTMLSEEEYVVQGSEETRLALQRLREYCLSPECNAWRTIGRLKNPTRFAEFVSTGQDLLEEELES